MRLQDNYDWIVLGSDPGALLSAGLAAHLGLSVLVLPLSPGMGLTVSQSGQVFDPETNYLLGLGSFGAQDGLTLECLNHLGILGSEKESIRTEGGIAHALTPQSRIALQLTESLSFELLREFGKKKAADFDWVKILKNSESTLLSYWSQLPKRLTLNTQKKPDASDFLTLEKVRRGLYKNLGQLGPHVQDWASSSKRASDLGDRLGIEDLQVLFEALCYSITSNVTPNPKLFEVLNLVSLSRLGATFRGGLTAYRDFLLKLCRRLGVHVLVEMECRRIFVEKNRFVGIQITNRGNMISSQGAVLGCSVERAYQRITSSGYRLFSSQKKPLTPVGWKFTLALTVSKEVFSNGALSRFIWQDREAPVLEFEIRNCTDYQIQEPDLRILYLRTILPYKPETLTPEYQRLFAGRMLRQAMEILPFLELHIKKIYPYFKPSLGALLNAQRHTRLFSGGVKGEDFSDVYSFTRLEEIPENLLEYQGEGFGSTTGIEGLFLASSESYPGLGSYGATIAALESVAWISHRSGHRGPFF